MPRRLRKGRNGRQKVDELVAPCLSFLSDIFSYLCSSFLSLPFTFCLDLCDQMLSIVLSHCLTDSTFNASQQLPSLTWTGVKGSCCNFPFIRTEGKDWTVSSGYNELRSHGTGERVRSGSRYSRICPVSHRFTLACSWSLLPRIICDINWS